MNNSRMMRGGVDGRGVKMSPDKHLIPWHEQVQLYSF